MSQYQCPVHLKCFPCQDYQILDILPGEFATLSELSGLFNLDYLKKAFSKFSEVELELKYSLNPENLFESACLNLIEFDNQIVQNAQPVQVAVNAAPTQVVQQQPTLQEAPQVARREQSEIERIWGNVLLKIKEKNLFALSNALMSVNKVSQIGDKLIITTNDSSSYETIDNSDRIELILKTVNLFDDSITQVLIEYDKQNASRQDIKDSLKDVFKDKIKFRN